MTDGTYTPTPNTSEDAAKGAHYRVVRYQQDYYIQKRFCKFFWRYIKGGTLRGTKLPIRYNSLDTAIAAARSLGEAAIVTKEYHSKKPYAYITKDGALIV